MRTATKPSPADLRYAASVFKALGHPDRLRILCELADTRLCTQTQMVEKLGRPQSTLARHLVPLRALGLVTGERDGQEVPLALSDTVVEELLDAVCDWIERRREAGAS